MTPDWIMWIAARTPTRLSWVSWAVLAVLTQVGAAVGVIASDLFWTAVWHWEYRGAEGKRRWSEEVRRTRETRAWEKYTEETGAGVVVTWLIPLDRE